MPNGPYDLKPIKVSKKDIGYFFASIILLAGTFLLAILLFLFAIGGCVECSSPSDLGLLRELFTTLFGLEWVAAIASLLAIGIALMYYSHKLPESDTRDRITRSETV